MAECKYRTDKSGNLCTFNAHPVAVQILYDVKVLVYELKFQHDGLDELIEAVEYELFSNSGISFAHWLNKNRLKKAIKELEDLKVHSWDTPEIAKLKRKIKKLLYRVVR